MRMASSEYRYSTSSYQPRRTRLPSRPRSRSPSIIMLGNRDRTRNRSFSPPPPPTQQQQANFNNNPRGRTSGKRRREPRAYSPGPAAEKRPSRKSTVTLTLAVFHSSRSHSWRTTPITFDRFRATDQSIWEDIRHAYRHQLQQEWRRLLLFTRLKHIVPIEVGLSLGFLLQGQEMLIDA